MDAITIVNRALARIGAIEIQSFDDPGPSGDAPRAIYDEALEDLLSRYPWKFAHQYAALGRLTAAPLRGWDHAFLLPPDRVGPARAYYDSAAAGARPLTKFELSADQLLTDADAVWAYYPYVPAVQHWPGYFRKLVTTVLAAELALAIREDEGLRRRLMAECFGPPEYRGEAGIFGEAMSLDSAAGASPQPADGANPVTDARWPAGDARHGFELW